MARPHFSWALTTGATTKTVRVTCNGVTSDLNLAESTYYWRGDGGGTDAALALQTALNTHPQAAGGFTVTIAESGYLTVAHAALNFSLLWNHANTTLTDADWGSDGTATASGLTWTSEYVVGKAWWPNRYAQRDYESERKVARHFEGVGVPGSTAVYGTWIERPCIFEQVDAPRCLSTWAADADMASRYGTDATDSNIAFEGTLWDRLWNGDGVYYHPKGVGFAVQNGPYYLAGQPERIDDLIQVQTKVGGRCSVTVPLRR